MARILIIDDSDEIRRLLRLMLVADPSLAIVGEASNGLEGIDRAEELAPDLIIMDLAMPVMDGIESTRRIKAASPDVEVVAFSATTDQSWVDAALAAGASAIVDKGDLDQLLVVLQELAVRPVAAATEAAPDPGLCHPRFWEGLRGRAAAIVASAGGVARSAGRVRLPGALALRGAAFATLLVFVVALQPHGLENRPSPRRPMVAAPNWDIPPSGPVVVEAVEPEPAKVDDKTGRRKGRATHPSDDRSNPAGSTEPSGIAQAAPAPSNGSSPSATGDSKSARRSSSKSEVIAMPAKHEVPGIAVTNYKARSGADKARGVAKARR